MRRKFIICILVSILISLFQVNAQNKNLNSAYFGAQIAGSTAPYSIRFGVKIYERFYIEPALGFLNVKNENETRNFNHFSLEGLYYSNINVLNGFLVFGIGAAYVSSTEWIYGRIGYYLPLLNNSLLFRFSIVPGLPMDPFEEPDETWIPAEISLLFNF